MVRLLAALGILLVIGFALSMLSPVTGIDSGRTVPVREGELWELNQR